MSVVQVIFTDGPVQVTVGPFEGVESNGQRLVSSDGRTVAHRTYAVQSRPPAVPRSGWVIEAPFATEDPVERDRLYDRALICLAVEASMTVRRVTGGPSIEAVRERPAGPFAEVPDVPSFTLNAAR